jgi:fumarate reductase subunit D
MSVAPAIGARSHANYVAFLVHRLSGIGLALFLPLHFWALGTAIEGEARLEHFLRWTDHPLAKAGELVLVVLLAAHLGGGLRVLAIEFLPWRDWQKSAVALSFAAALVVGLVFLLNLG